MAADSQPSPAYRSLDIRHTRLTVDQQQALLALARRALVTHLQGRSLLVPAELSDPLLDSCAGVFVTLWRLRPPATPLLRGCVGRIECAEPLAHTIPVLAVSAATRDLRFPPVTAAEFPEIRVTISILSPLSSLLALEQVSLGRDGLVLEVPGRRALFLPEVPLTFGWNHEQFAAGLCQKLDLPDDYWRRPDVRLLTFTTLSFAES